MKKLLVAVLVLGIGIYMYGCGKKESVDMTEQLSMDAMTAPGATEVTASPQAPMPQAPVVAPTVTETAPLPLPPSGPFKPGAVEIQTALKNAGYYTGALDGKLGPMSKKAVEEFQKANNLKADGKVGPKTWELLKAHLSLEPSTVDIKKR